VRVKNYQARVSRRFAKKVLEKEKDKKKVCTQCRREFLIRPCCERLFSVLMFYPSSRALLPQCAFVFDLNSSQFFLKALIFVVLIADFIASPGHVNYDALAVGIFLTTTTQNVLEIVAVAVIMRSSLHTIVIVIVAATTAIAAATVANPVSKVSDQRQLR